VLYRANPYWKGIGWHDWCLAEDERTCRKQTAAHQLMIFFEIKGMDDPDACDLVADGEGLYAWTVRTVRADLFGDREAGKTTNYYGKNYSSILDDNASFVVWDAKETVEFIKQQSNITTEGQVRLMYRVLPLYLVGDPLIGIHDPDSTTPYTYIFVESRQTWPKRFMDYVNQAVESDREGRKKQRCE
jgi:hypothetical protein